MYLMENATLHITRFCNSTIVSTYFIFLLVCTHIYSLLMFWLGWFFFRYIIICPDFSARSIVCVIISLIIKLHISNCYTVYFEIFDLCIPTTKDPIVPVNEINCNIIAIKSNFVSFTLIISKYQDENWYVYFNKSNW